MPRRAKKPPIEAIIFDIGRVIVALDPARALTFINSSTAPKSLTSDQIWAVIRKDPLFKMWEEGRVSPHKWYKHLTRQFSPGISFKTFCDAWISVLLPKQILPNQLFARLSKKCRLVLVSNTDRLHVKYMEAHFGFMRYFPARIYSFRVGAIKPSPRIFRAAIRAAAAPPHRILYIDDILPFVRAGRRLGLDAIQFKSRRQLEAALRLRRLLP